MESINSGNCWDRKNELLSREEIEGMQAHKLSSLIERCSESRYYKEMFKRKGITPDRIKTTKDIKRIDFIDKSILREETSWRFLAVKGEHVVRMHSSSGTTGQATVVFHTKGDIEEWAELIARCMYMVGVRRQDVFQNMMGYGLFTGGLGFHYGAERLGCMVIPSGAGNSKRQISLMREFGTTTIHIIPSYALRLQSVFEELNIDPEKDLKLTTAFIGAEPHSERLREKLENALGVDAYNSYGLSEMCGPGVAFECRGKAGMHLWEDKYIMEIIDPKTLEPMPDGEEGELVLTSLNREAMPLIRYRTHDLTRIVKGDCVCGRKHRRIERIKGRTDDMFIIKGVNIFPMQVERVLLKTVGVGSNYQIILHRKGSADNMKVKVEVSDEMWRGDLEDLKRLKIRLESEMRDEILVKPELELVEPGLIDTGEGKAKRVIDERDGAILE